MKCECCKSKSQWTLKSQYGGMDYNVCSNCLTDLVNCHLSKKQFKEILKSGHTTDEFLLHEDFYDETGLMLQPTEYI